MVNKSFSVLNIAFIGCAFVSMSALSSPDCANLKGCEEKFCEIEKQLKISQEIGNQHKTKGLKISLKNAKEHCTDKGLKEDLVAEIKESNEEILEYKNDLQEAIEDQKRDKVRKYQDKINEENNKITYLKSKLADLE